MLTAETIHKIEDALQDVPYGEAKRVMVAINGAPSAAAPSRRKPQHAELKDAVAATSTGKRRGRPPKAEGSGDDGAKKAERAAYASGYRAGSAGKPQAVPATEAYVRGWKAGWAKAHEASAPPIAPMAPPATIAPPAPLMPTATEADQALPIAPALPVSA